MRRLWLYCLASLVIDWVVYVVLTIIPLRAADLGASARDLGILQACFAAVYVLMSLVVGRVADRVSRPLLARIGCALAIAACLLIPRASTYGWLLATVPLAALAGTFFWPSVQSAIAAEAPPGKLERDIGLFNVFFSIGKSIGFVTAAALKGAAGVGTTLLAAGAGAAAVTLFYPLRDVRRPAEPAENRADPRLRMTFLYLSWVMNFVAYGVGATLGNQYIKLCQERSIGLGFGANPPEMFFGVFLFATFACQTATFAVLRARPGWTYRRAPLYAAQVLMAAGTLAVALLSNGWWLLLSTPLIGVGLGFGNAASIYYSLHTPAGHGRYAGLHEAILGSGNFVLPLAAGALATGLGDLRWPYWLCAACAVAALAVQETIYRARTSRSSSPK